MSHDLTTTMGKDRRSWPHHCAFLLSLSTLGLATAGPAPELCGAANFDVRNLTSKLWRFAVPSESCLGPRTVGGSVEGCEVTMGFCQSVKLSVPCVQAAVCESFGSVNSSYNLASYEPYSNPFNTAALISGIGFTTQYENGETYIKPDQTQCTLSTRMTFLCNMSAIWDSDKAGDILTVPVTPKVELTLRDKVCIYNLTFDFAGACPVVAPGEPVSLLSAGTVLLLIFFMTAVIYFMLGSFINVLRGQSGQGVLPHHQFWTSLPGYIKDGVQFTVTCGGRSPRKQTYENI